MQAVHEEHALLSNSKYRTYVAQIDKVLKSFEVTSEWADLISALGKLNKVLNNNSKFEVVPRRITIGKRLSQCLHPALPSGVHLKALESYSIIFRLIGTKRLSADVFIYSSGLFPLLGFAALNVRPALLTLYETYFVPLGEGLRPILPGLLQAILPGLDDGGEHFQRCERLLEQICDVSKAAYFYTSLWQCVVGSSAIRLAAIQFVLSHFKKGMSMDDQIYLIGNSLEILVEALCLSLVDQSVLVQRSTLDLLICGFPIHRSPLVRSDMIRVGSAAIDVLMRRDMSLNRRLYSWLLGAEATADTSNQEKQISYLLNNSRDLLCKSFLLLMEKCSLCAPTKPFRIVISLLDKPEIGNLITDDCLLSLLFYVRSEYDKGPMQEAEDSERRVELVKGLNLMLSSYQSDFLWNHLSAKFEEICQESEVHRINSFCLLAVFLLDKITLDSYAEVRSQLLPLFLQNILKAITTSTVHLDHLQLLAVIKLSLCLLVASQPSNHEKSQEVILSCIKLSQTLFAVSFHQHVFDAMHSSTLDEMWESLQSKEGLSYPSPLRHCLVIKPGMLELLDKCSCFLLDLAVFPLYGLASSAIMCLDREAEVPMWLRILMVVTSYASNHAATLSGMQVLLELIRQAVSSLSHLRSLPEMLPSKETVSVLLLPVISEEHLRFIADQTSFYQILARKLWEQMDESLSELHQASANLLQRLHMVAPSPWLTQDLICSELFSEDTRVRLSAHQRFCTLWHFLQDDKTLRAFDRCECVILDSVGNSKRPDCAEVCAYWLGRVLKRGELAALLQPLFVLLLHPDTARISRQTKQEKQRKSDSGESEEDIEKKIYAISSERGNVVYHTNRGDEKKQSSPSTPITAILTMLSKEGTSHQSSGFHEEMLFDRFNSTDVTLHVNPLMGSDGMSSSCHSLSSSVNGVVRPHQDVNGPKNGLAGNVLAGNVLRLDSHICKKAGISFNSDVEDEDEESTTLLTEQGSAPSPPEPPADDDGGDVATQVVNTIVDELLEEVFGKLHLSKSSQVVMQPSIVDDRPEEFDDVDISQELARSHLLYYQHRLDTDQVKYALKCLQSIIEVKPKEVVYALVTNAVNSGNNAVISLLARHRRSVLGYHFFSELPNNSIASLRGCMLIELVVSLSLYYLRSEPLLSSISVADNQLVQLQAASVMLSLVENLTAISLSASKNFSTYIYDLLARCKVQKTVMHCLVLAIADGINTVQSSLLKMIFQLIQLERNIFDKANLMLPALPNGWSSVTASTMPNLSDNPFLSGQPLIHQLLLLNSTLIALRQMSQFSIKSHWLQFIESALPFLGASLAPSVTVYTAQICRNVEVLADCYKLERNFNRLRRLPPDLLVMLLESLTHIVHFCLLQKDSGDDMGKSGKFYEDARLRLLSILPRLLATFVRLWIYVGGDGAQVKAALLLGAPKKLLHLMLELLSPIAVQHSFNTLAAIGIVWNDSSEKEDALSREQEILVEIMMSIKVIPLDTLLQTIVRVVQMPPKVSSSLRPEQKSATVEISILEFLLAFVEQCSANHIVQSTNEYLSFLRQCAAVPLPPPAYFLLLRLLNVFVRKVPFFEEKKKQRDVQELAQQLVDLCNSVAAGSLQQTSWLGRNLAVKNVCDAHSVAALSLLSEIMPHLLDVIYPSDEKDRLIPFLTTILLNVFPYLRDHSESNVPSYMACSLLLARLSSYQYTRKCWRREVLELLLESSFFTMNWKCLEIWRDTIDNLMTQDKNFFKELVLRLAMSSGSINLFSSREQELQQRAQVLKRMSFCVFCGESDQYHHYLPQIQECLSEILRHTSVPLLLSQVFLCLRVLLLRLSTNHLNSLWPVITSELINVLLLMEQDLDVSRKLKSSDKEESHHWLNLYLSAAKLIAVCFRLPSTFLPQFEIYRWALVCGGEPVYKDSYVPHIARIVKIMESQFGKLSDQENTGKVDVLQIRSIYSLSELQPFFSHVNSLSLPDYASIEQIESDIQNEFIETGNKLLHTST